jgi:hypothetical protein
LADELGDSLGETSMLWRCQIRIAREQLLGTVASRFEQASIVQRREAQLWQAALANPEEIARAALPQVEFRQLQTVIRPREHL